MDDFHKKYIKYLTKNNKLNIQLKEINMVGGNRFNCDPKIEEFSKICTDDKDGKYKSRESCVNDCESKYIEHQLTKYGLSGETSIFYRFIKNLMTEEHIDVVIRGGNVLGLKILKMIYNKYPGDKFDKYFDDFLKLDLIKDWDFSGCPRMSEPIDAKYRKKLDKLANKFRLVPRAKTFILYQTRKPILTDDKALFEIAIRDPDTFAGLELPLTTMEVKVNQYNLKHIFMFANSFYAYKTRNSKFDLDVIKRMIQKINIFIYPHKEGLFVVNHSDFTPGNLSASLINFIETYGDIDKNLPQFLAMHIEEPHRIFYRLVQKNIPKAERLTKFIKHINLSHNIPDWIFDPAQIKKIMTQFLEALGEKMKEIFMEKGQFLNKTDDIKPAFDDLVNFTAGINFSRIDLTFDDMNDEGKKLIKKLFSKLIDVLDKDSIKKLPDDSKLIKTIKFLYSKNLF